MGGGEGETGGGGDTEAEGRGQVGRGPMGGAHEERPGR